MQKQMYKTRDKVIYIQDDEDINSHCIIGKAYKIVKTEPDIPEYQLDNFQWVSDHQIELAPKETK